MNQGDLFGITLADYRNQLMIDAQVGTHCKACGQHAKIYHNKFNSSMARIAIWLYPHFKKHPDDWLEAGKYLVQNHDRYDGVHSKLCVYEMMHKNTAARPITGAKSSGLYRMTEKGIAFVEERIKVPSHWTQYNGDVLHFDGDDIGIREALGKHFDYAELMAEIGCWRQGKYI